MRKARKPTRKEQAAINRIQKAFNGFPETLQVFALAGAMVIVDKKSKQVFLTILGTTADGGDPGTVDVGGAEFLNLN